MPSDLGAVYFSDIESLTVAFESDPNLKLTLTRDGLRKKFPDVDLKFDQLAVQVYLRSLHTHLYQLCACA